MASKEDVGMKIKMNVKCFKDIDKLAAGNSIDEKQIFDLIDFVNNRYDCADFRLICLLKTYIYYRQNLSEKCQNAIKECILKFKYWMDEPNDDGMCYWSENHQLLFHACELLAGQLFPDEIFSNNNMTGKEHYQKALPKIIRWLDYRFKFGFIEWHSNTYYEEDISPLCVLVDCAMDENVVSKSKIILDLFFFDLALHTFDGYFVATSGRCYEMQKKDRLQADVNDILKFAFGIQKPENYDYERISAMYLLCKNYKVPKIIVEIAHCQDKARICDSMGLALKEVKKEIPNGEIDDRGMYLWQMEAFTNPEAVTNSLNIFNEWKLFENNFLQDFKMINIGILRKLHLLPLLTRILKPGMNGVAIQRANTMTFKCESYMLSTAQNYHYKEFGDQQHIWQASLLNNVNVFSTNPACPMFDDSARNFSPSYWVGNGINPLCYQNDNVMLMSYKLDVRKGFMEKDRQHLVHFFFPQKKFDKVILRKTEVFGKVGDGYIAILSKLPIAVENDEELKIVGKIHNYAVVMGDKKDYNGFDEFVKSFENYKLSGNSNGTSLEFNSQNYEMKYKKGLSVNGEKIRTDYDRFETPYCNAKRRPEQVVIAFKGKKLILDINKMTREETNGKPTID